MMKLNELENEIKKLEDWEVMSWRWRREALDEAKKMETLVKKMDTLGKASINVWDLALLSADNDLTEANLSSKLKSQLED